MLRIVKKVNMKKQKIFLLFYSSFHTLRLSIRALSPAFSLILIVIPSLSLYISPFPLSPLSISPIHFCLSHTCSPLAFLFEI